MYKHFIDELSIVNAELNQPEVMSRITLNLGTNQSDGENVRRHHFCTQALNVFLHFEKYSLYLKYILEKNVAYATTMPHYK